MLMGVRTTQCPQCGAAVTFGLASTPSLVCPYCQAVVVRTDEGVRAGGKMSDLVPTASPLEVGDTITVEGRAATVVGRSQRDWGQGPWDEFYVSFADGATAWLSRAQGRWYALGRVDSTHVNLPHFHQLEVGSRGSFAPDPTSWTVDEKRSSRLVSAKGEFDSVLVPNEVNSYVDLSAEGAKFATIDYGDFTERPVFYMGRILAGDAVVVVTSNAGPRPEQRITSSKIACPNCGAPIQLLNPEQTESVVCASCGNLLSPTAGGLQVLDNLAKNQVARPSIPLGRKGTLRGVLYTVIGYMRRYTIVDGQRYFWGEYLLYSDKGYAWLVEDNGHFMLARTIANSDITKSLAGYMYQGKRFKAFFENEAYVDSVVGEFYWAVRIGEKVVMSDYIAPPQVISIEKNENEIITSLSDHVPRSEVEKAFVVTLPRDASDEVPVSSPKPGVHPGILAGLAAAAMVVMFVLALIHGATYPEQPVVTMPLAVDPKLGYAMNFVGPRPADPARSVTYSESFAVPKGPTTVGFSLRTTAVNVWVGGECALINDNTGEVLEFAVDTGFYEGYTGGEHWTEGSHTNTEYLAGVSPGYYSVRCATDWEPYNGIGAYQPVPIPPTADLQVVVNQRAYAMALIILALLWLPFAVTVFWRMQHEKSRWANSNLVVSE